MKFILTESAIKRAISKYLDKKDFIILDMGKTFNNYIYLYNSSDDEVAQICVYTTNAIGEKRNWVFVTYYLIEEISEFFTIDREIALDIIGDWVGEKLSITPKRVEDARKEGNYRLIIEK